MRKASTPPQELPERGVAVRMSRRTVVDARDVFARELLATLGILLVEARAVRKTAGSREATRVRRAAARGVVLRRWILAVATLRKQRAAVSAGAAAARVGARIATGAAAFGAAAASVGRRRSGRARVARARAVRRAAGEDQQRDCKTHEDARLHAAFYVGRPDLFPRERSLPDRQFLTA